MSRAVAIYARYSTDQQDARSIDDQFRRCREFADRHGMVVVQTYKDEAISGSHMHRPDLQRLLKDAAMGRKRTFSVLLVDDLSRLSRDLWDMGKIVFGDLAALGVPVVDVMTGMSSDAPSARQMFAAMGMSNDFFLQMVKAETHRGLEGRALAGFSTGGRVYGYSTVEEKDPADREHPRKRHIINQREADIVVRIFEEFASGLSTKVIAARLNADGVPAPYDGGHAAKRDGGGWPHTTIQAVIKNERYTGRWVWNASKWVRVPGLKSRRRVMRPDSERIVSNRPDLRIISDELWLAVKNRTRRGPKPGVGRPPGSGRRCHVLSGLLRCGVCGAGMGVVGQRVKNGVRYAQLGCNGHHSRGPTACSNGLTVSEKITVTALVGSMQRLLTERGLFGRFAARVRQRLDHQQRENSGDKLEALKRQLRECARRIDNLTEGLAKGGWNQTLAQKLKEEEARRVAVEAELSTAEGKTRLLVLPSDDILREHLARVLRLVTVDVTRGREALLHCLQPFVLTPENDNGTLRYRATGALSLSLILKTPSSSGLEDGVSGKPHCGGAIPPYPSTTLRLNAGVRGKSSTHPEDMEAKRGNLPHSTTASSLSASGTSVRRRRHRARL